MAKIGVVSLGCAKNQVDTERMLGLLTSAGHTVTPDPAEADGGLELMKLRHLIERVGMAPSPRTVAIVATPATVDDGSTGSVATVASIATPPDPRRWAHVLQALSVEGVDLRLAADALGQPLTGSRF